MRGALLLLLASGCVFFRADFPCEGDANCPEPDVCVDARCAAEGEGEGEPAPRCVALEERNTRLNINEVRDIEQRRPAGFPETCLLVDDDLTIREADLTNLRGLEYVARVTGDVEIVNNDRLETLSGLSELVVVEGDLIIRRNDRLVSIEGLSALTSVEGALEVENNNLLEAASVDEFAAGLEVLGSLVNQGNGP